MSRAEAGAGSAEGDTPTGRMLPHLSLLTGQNVVVDGDQLQGRVFRVFESLDELVTTVEEARGVPMTSSCIVPRGDVLELLDDIRDAIPAEFDDAQDVLDHRDELIDTARQEAQRQRDDANTEAERASAAARDEAARLVAEARAQAESMVAGAKGEADRLEATGRREYQEVTSHAEAEAERMTAAGRASYERAVADGRAEQARLV
ncbi:MAG: DivIVA domain-containing protein, partial [Pseudonocardiales bacterium]|nr:DivIVA domain-containing protein [Pseudonocardiales bacterium]